MFLCFGVWDSEVHGDLHSSRVRFGIHELMISCVVNRSCVIACCGIEGTG